MMPSESAHLPLTASMPHLAELQALIASDRARMRVLALVAELGLPDCWVAAGFVRSRVWDHLHGFPESPLYGDIDVVWFDPRHAGPERDAELERVLRARDGTLDWSVKNQARMHMRNADRPYRNAPDAMAHWPETATAVGVRLDAQGAVDVAAPFGLDDLFGLVLQPTPRFMAEKYPVYLERIRTRDWPSRWPRLRFFSPAAP
jgi:hypothetical protein